MESKINLSNKNLLNPEASEPTASTSNHDSEPKAVCPNEAAVPLAFEELSPYVRIVKPSRPSLTYDRIE